MKHYTEVTGQASMGILGKWVRAENIWGTVEEKVKINQKIIKYRPTEKLKGLFVNILAGGEGVSDINHRLRIDVGIQRAFAMTECPEQSTISQTLSACQMANVRELRKSLQEIYRKHGQGYRHDYGRQYQILDIDLSALLSGEQAEEATKGYFSGSENRRGRQLGRVLASRYNEIVCEKIYNGKVQLEKNLPELVELAEEVLELDEAKCKCTFLRLDAGGGTETNINFILKRGYRFITKIKNWQRTCKLVKTVTQWHPLPGLPDHECGWVESPIQFETDTRQLAIRWPNQKKPDEYRASVLVFNLSDPDIFTLLNRPLPDPCSDICLWSAIVHLYDQRGGGIESSFRNSKQGLAITKRNKKSFHAQEMLILLAELAYNIIIWVQSELARHSSTIASYGLLRMVRCAFHIAGSIHFYPDGNIQWIRLNGLHPLAPAFQSYCRSKESFSDLRIILRKN